MTISKIEFMLLIRADTAIIISHHSQLSALLFSNTNCLKLLAHIPCSFLTLSLFFALAEPEMPFPPISDQVVPFLLLLLSSGVSSSRELLHTTFIFARAMWHPICTGLWIAPGQELRSVLISYCCYTPGILAKCLEHSMQSVAIAWTKV